MLNGVDLETEELKRLLLLAKHCELTDDSGTVDWPRVRMYFYLYLRERLTSKVSPFPCLQLNYVIEHLPEP